MSPFWNSVSSVPWARHWTMVVCEHKPHSPIDLHWFIWEYEPTYKTCCQVGWIFPPWLPEKHAGNCNGKTSWKLTGKCSNDKKKPSYIYSTLIQWDECWAFNNIPIIKTNNLDLQCSLSGQTSDLLPSSFACYHFPFPDLVLPLLLSVPLGQEAERSGQSKETIPPPSRCPPSLSPSPALSSITKPLVHFDYLH